jgi:HEAT repeat protein
VSGFSFYFFIYVAVGEFIVVFMIIFLLYIIKINMLMKSKKAKKNFNKLKSYCEKCIVSEKKIDSGIIDDDLIGLDVLVSVLTELDSEQQDNSFWFNKLRYEFLLEYVLPMARLLALSGNGFNKMSAARAFRLIAEKEDENIIVDLIRNPNRAICLALQYSALQLPTEKVIDALIDAMVSMKLIAFTEVIENFDQLPGATVTYVSNRLDYEKNTLKRTICYRILERNRASLPQCINKDINSKDLELVLSVIDYLKVCDKNSAVPILIAKFSDSRVPVRIAAMHALQKLHAVGSVLDIAALLNDASYLIRLRAAFVLKNLGEEGLSILSKIINCKDHIANREVEEVLHGMVEP